MTTIPLHDGRLIGVVEVPEGYDPAYGMAFDTSVKNWLRYYPKNRINSHDSRIIELLPRNNTYTLLFLTSTMTEDDARGVVQIRLGIVNDRFEKVYGNYDDGEGFLTALESFTSLLKANGLVGNNYAVLEIKK